MQCLHRCVFCARSRRSICRGLIRSNCLAVSARKRKRLRIHGIHCGKSAFNRTDQEYPAASHTAVKTASVSAW